MSAAILALVLTTSQPPAGTNCARVMESNEPVERLSAEQKLELVTCAFAATARDVSGGLPTTVDEMTTLIGVIPAGPHLIYNMRLDVLAGELSPAEIERRSARVIANVCDTPGMRLSISMGGAFSYVWLDRDGRRITTFKIESC